MAPCSLEEQISKPHGQTAFPKKLDEVQVLRAMSVPRQTRSSEAGPLVRDACLLSTLPELARSLETLTKAQE